jgi:hypothetical protein
VVNNIAGEGPRRRITGFTSSGVKSVAESGVLFFVLTIIILIFLAAATLFSPVKNQSMCHQAVFIAELFYHKAALSQSYVSSRYLILFTLWCPIPG